MRVNTARLQILQLSLDKSGRDDYGKTSPVVLLYPSLNLMRNHRKNQQDLGDQTEGFSSKLDDGRHRSVTALEKQHENAPLKCAVSY